MDYTQILKNFLDDSERVTAYPSRRKLKVAVLLYMATKFEQGRLYSEKEVNEVLNEWHTFEDPATLRREMYDYKIFDRTDDCRRYWLEDVQPTMESLGMA